MDVNQELLVKPANEFHEESENVYSMKHKPRGFCMIINNYKGDNDEMFSDRAGSIIDRKSLEFVFSQLGFKVIVHENLNAHDMKLKCSDLSQDKEMNKHDALAVIFLSHGDNGEIIGVDGKSVEVEELLEFFNNDECDYLKGKPKMFFVSACRGSKLDKIRDKPRLRTEADESGPAWTDMIVCYSTIPGYASLRKTSTGTWFGEILAHKIAEHAHEMHLEDILKQVSRQIRKRIDEIKDETSGVYSRVKQGMSIDHRGFDKYLYFNPQIYETN